MQDQFKLSLERRVVDGDEVYLFFNSAIDGKKIGDAAININYPRREITVSQFQPVIDKNYRNGGLGTLSLGLILTGSVLIEDIDRDFALIDDFENPLCVRKALEKMGLKSGIQISDFMGSFKDYAQKKGHYFHDPFEEKRRILGRLN
jgi:hypothetical protein